MMNRQIPIKFDVKIFGKMEQLTPTYSKARVRIFYKGFNRNRTFISEEFAQQLIDSLPYTPIKGIFDYDDVDYTDHGKKSSEGKIYGIVMANPNFAWEEHEDDDGEIRTYACADVLIYTALYPEARLIPEKGQSMEIDPNSLVGEWRTWTDGEPYYHFIKGCLLGLQVLGDMTEPCFEGAEFYSLKQDIADIVQYMKKFEEKEEKKMDKTLFKLSDDEKYDVLMNLVNPNFTEEGGWVQDRVIMKVYDDYALCCNLTSGTYERVAYTKDNDNITIGDFTEVVIVDVTKEEQIALEAIKATSGSFELAKDTIDSVETIKTECSEKETAFSTEKESLETKISEFEAQVNTLQTEKEGLEAQITDFTTKINDFEAEKVEMEQKINDITSENESLVSFKKATELEKKMDILNKYEQYINEESYKNLKDNMDKFEISDFKKEVCTAAVESTPSIFEKENSGEQLFYKAEQETKPPVPASCMERILDKYKK